MKSKQHIWVSASQLARKIRTIPLLCRLRQLLLCCAVALISPASAQEGEFHFRYLVQWGNFALGQSDAQWQFTENTVRMSGISIPKGSFATFTDFEGKLSFEAVRGEMNWQPVSLMMYSREGEDIRTAETLWSEDGRNATTTNSPPADLEEVFPLTPDMRIDATSPFSAMLDMLDRLEAGQKCEGRFEIYDGWRRATLEFADFGAGMLEADRGWAYEGEVSICGIRSVPKGGHRRESRYRPEEPDFEKIKAYIGRHSSGRLVPVRIEVKIPVGRITARLDMRSPLPEK